MYKNFIIILLVTSVLSSGVMVSSEKMLYEVKLPEEFITMNVDYGLDSWFVMELSNIPEGFDVCNGLYAGWCVQRDIEMTRNVDHAVRLYSSYDPDMPERYKNDNWSKINYLINHKQGDKRSIEKVIWYYLDDYPLPVDNDSLVMIADADEKGEGFVPKPGQKLSIVAEGVESIQKTIIEFTLPTSSSNEPKKQSGSSSQKSSRSYTSINHAPVADGTAGEPYIGLVGEEIEFNGSRSYDRDGEIVSYKWFFGDESNSSGMIVSHVYITEGTFNVSLEVVDNKGYVNEYVTSVDIRIGNHPPMKPTIYGQTACMINQTYQYSVVSIDPDEDRIQYLFDWGNGNNSTSDFSRSNAVVMESYSWDTAGIYDVSVLASDNKSISEKTSLTVFVDTMYVKELGILYDTDGDGVFDRFYSNESGISNPVMQRNDGLYEIDINGDGVGDKLYDPINDDLHQFSTELAGAPFNIYVIFFAIALGIMLIALITYQWKK